MKAKNHLYLSGAIFSFVVGVYAPYLISCKRAKRGKKEFPSEMDRLSAYSGKIKIYDNILVYQEYLNGALFFRRKLAALSKGDVLEVAAGSCRNIHFFKSPPVSSLTFTDIVPDLLSWSSEKYFGEQKITKIAIKDNENICFEYKRPGSVPIPVKLAKSDTSDLKDFEADSFDTVIDSFGLCSYETPLKAIDEMIRVCKPGGRILFLEHGKGSNRLINLILARKRLRHLESWGCFWDRNILDLISTNDKIEVTHVERKTMGTVYFGIAIKK